MKSRYERLQKLKENWNMQIDGLNNYPGGGCH